MNNAGMSPLYESLPKVSEELYDKVLAVNLRGPFRLSSVIGSRMAAGGGGSIINISSIAAVQPTPTELAAFVADKDPRKRETVIDRLFARPEHPYTEALLGALPQLEDGTARTGRLTAIPGRPPDLLYPPEGCRFAARCPYANEADGCATHMPELRELRPGHLVRSEHPATKRARRREAAPA